MTDIEYTKTGADFFIETNPTDAALADAVAATATHGAKLIAEQNKRKGFTTASVGSLDPGCICFGNWRLIVAETEHLLDKQFIEERTGNIYTYCGALHGSDDFYYTMYSKDDGLRLLSCVGSFEQMGFKLYEEPDLPPSYGALLDEIESLKEQLASLQRTLT